MTNEIAIKDSNDFLAMLERLASSPEVDPAKFHAMLDVQERILNKKAESEFNQALARLIKKIPRVKRDGTVEYAVDKNKPDGAKKKAFDFATWENVDSIIRPLLEEEGFILSFDSQMKEGGGAIITGTILHSAGHSRSASIPLALDASGGKNNLQGMGSTLSYGKRYTTFMLLNIVTEGEDDDGKRGGMVFINDAQISEINKLIEETKSNKDKFLEMLEVVAIENLQCKDFAKAINALMAKKAKMK